jgi:hypothetical protein
LIATRQDEVYLCRRGARRFVFPSALASLIHSARSAVAILSLFSLSACGAPPFSSPNQYRNFNGMSYYLAQIQEGLKDQDIANRSSAGVMVVFETSGENIRVKHLIRGKNFESAMSDLMAKGLDPCLSSGPNAAVAGFAPPPTDALPMSFARCSTLVDEINQKMAIAADLNRIHGLLKQQAQLNDVERQTIRKIIKTTSSNSTDINSLSKDLTNITSVQQASWDQVMSKFKEIVDKLQSDIK